MSNNKTINVAVTGAAGQIGYSILFRIASGEIFGKDTHINLNLLEITPSLNALKGVVMELEDCAFPLVKSLSISDEPEIAFKDADYAILIGARPRGKGMERADLLQANAKIFIEQGKALNNVAHDNTKILVVGNPANTNAYIAMKSAPNIPKKNFTAMLRLDHNRALSQLSQKANSDVNSISGLVVWGNHSPTMYPDIRYTKINGESAEKLISDREWYENYFIPTVAKRGAAIIDARGLSSAASAANAAIDHIRDWHNGSSKPWTTMGVPSNGEYNIPENIIFGFPCICENNDYQIVNDLDIDQFSQKMIYNTLNELIEEQKSVESLLKG